MSIAVAIMQPYIFPYFGYMQLVEASDIFVFYDDVTFIKQGWVNRNRIIINKAIYTFTIPLHEASSFKWIAHTQLKDIEHFKKKFIKQVSQSYASAPGYALGLEYIEAVLSGKPTSISDISQKSVTLFFDLLGIEKQFLKSSDLPIAKPGQFSAADRLIEITKHLGGDIYLNPIGGVELYSKAYFASKGIQLNFVSPELKPYRQGKGVEFIPSLSIIDVIMHLEPAEIRERLSDYQLK